MARKMQAPKPRTAGRNAAFNEAMQELGRSSATSRHKAGTDYNRKPKHRNRQFADAF